MDKEYQRLKRLLVIAWVLLVLLILGIVAWGSYELRRLKVEIATRPTHTETIIERPLTMQPLAPVQGLQGIQGVPGVQGPKGNPAPVVPGPQGPQGEQGIPGKDGKDGVDGTPAREVELGRNALGEEVWRYVGTKIWQVFEVVE